MAFQIDFQVPKKYRHAVNNNVHDEAAWGLAHEWAELKLSEYNWPRQFAAHYIYEFVNRPWLPDEQRMIELAAWMREYRLCSDTSRVKV